MQNRLLLLLLLLPWMFSVVLAPAGCAAPAHEAVPYRFRQPMVGWDVEEAPPAPRRRPSPRPAPAAQASPCRGLVGRSFPGPHARAVARLLRACLGHSVTWSELRAAALRRDAPRVGDLVLFDNTRDVNGNQRLDDRLSDAGVVTGVTGARVHFIFLRNGRTHAGVLNLVQPHRRRLSSLRRIENTFLRTKLATDPPQTRYLAGQLLAGFATKERGSRL